MSFLEPLSGLEVEGVVERLGVEQQREAVRLPHLRPPLNRPVVLAEYLKLANEGTQPCLPRIPIPFFGIGELSAKSHCKALCRTEFTFSQ